MVTNNGLIGDLLPNDAMTCSDVLIYLLQINKSPFTYCNDSNFRRTCCQTCKSKFEILKELVDFSLLPTTQSIFAVLDAFSCEDSNPTLCQGSASSCNVPDASINGIPIKLACQRTCSSCIQRQLKCSSNLCQNGATCVDVAATLNYLIGFICQCRFGYSGNFCELSKD